MLKRIIPDSTPLNQIRLVGPFVTLFAPPSNNLKFNRHNLILFADIDPNHGDAHGNNALAAMRDKLFSHYHIILPGKQPLDIELKDLLMSDRHIYGISEDQIDKCVEQYQIHVQNYSPSEHKLAVRNLIRSAVRYHYVKLDDSNGSDNEEVHTKVEQIKHALADSMIKCDYESYELFRKTLHDALVSFDKQEDKNALLRKLVNFMPESPFQGFNHLMTERSFYGTDMSWVGFLAALAPITSYIAVRSLTARAFSDSEEKPKLSDLDLFLIAGMTYKAPEIAESVYTRGKELIFGRQPYISNPDLKEIVDAQRVHDAKNEREVHRQRLH